MARKKAPKKAATPRRKTEAMEEICFVIMPFGHWFDVYYDEIYIPAITKAKLKPVRADDMYRPSSIVKDIWSLTNQAKIVLADMTGKNPNVFYELGLAHATKTPAVLVAESMSDVPFDLRALRVLEYNRNHPGWGGILQDAITSSLGEVLAAPEDAVPPAFLELEQQSKTGPITAEQKELMQLRKEVRLIAESVGTSEIKTRNGSRSFLPGSGSSSENKIHDALINLTIQGSVTDFTVDDDHALVTFANRNGRERTTKVLESMGWYPYEAY